MMRNKGQLAYVAQNTENYLQTSRKTLSERLDNVMLGEAAKEEIRSESASKKIVGTGLSLLGPIGDIATVILDWNDEVNQNMTEAKKMLLLGQYFDKVDNQEEAIKQIQVFLTNAQGNALFNKILRMLEDSPPDDELSSHLSSVLKKIIEAEYFEALFEKHRFALGQLERLTPQAMTIISDYCNWTDVNLGVVTAENGKVTSDFHQGFAESYCKVKEITEVEKIKRVQHSVIELRNQGLMEAYLEASAVRCELTRIGKEILAYLSN